MEPNDENWPVLKAGNRMLPCGICGVKVRESVMEYGNCPSCETLRIGFLADYHVLIQRSGLHVTSCGCCPDRVKACEDGPDETVRWLKEN